MHAARLKKRLKLGDLQKNLSGRPLRKIVSDDFKKIKLRVLQKKQAFDLRKVFGGPTYEKT